MLGETLASCASERAFGGAAAAPPKRSPNTLSKIGFSTTAKGLLTSTPAPFRRAITSFVLRFNSRAISYMRLLICYIPLRVLTRSFNSVACAWCDRLTQASLEPFPSRSMSLDSSPRDAKTDHCDHHDLLVAGCTTGTLTAPGAQA